MESEKPTEGFPWNPPLRSRANLTIWNAWWIQRGNMFWYSPLRSCICFCDPLLTVLRLRQACSENLTTCEKTHPPKNTLVGLLAVFCKEVIWSNPASRKQGSGSVNCHNLGYNSTKRAEITLVTLIYFLPVVGVISLYKFHVQIAIGSRWRDFPSKFPWESRANTITVRRIIANHTSVLRDPRGAGGCWSIPPKGTPRNGKGFLFSKLLRIVLVCFRGMLCWKILRKNGCWGYMLGMKFYPVMLEILRRQWKKGAFGYLWVHVGDDSSYPVMLEIIS